MKTFCEGHRIVLYLPFENALKPENYLLNLLWIYLFDVFFEKMIPYGPSIN